MMRTCGFEDTEYNLGEMNCTDKYSELQNEQNPLRGETQVSIEDYVSVDFLY